MGPFYKKLRCHLLAVPEKVYTTDDQQVNCVISNDTQGITVSISNYRVF